MRSIVALIALSLLAVPLRADDGAASIAAGGIVLMKREPRIVMAKEVLRISPVNVIVDYDFRNDSDQDITTEVAFPIPAYTFDDYVESNGRPGFDDFKLAVNGTTARFATEIRAYSGKHEITLLLAQNHIDAATFGHSRLDEGYDPSNNDLQHLSRAARQELITLGAVKDSDPAWRVEKKYHWTQTFPARSIVHIRHEYTPVLGNSNTIGDPANYQGKSAVPEYAMSCPDPALRSTLSKIWTARQNDEPSPLWISYVDFILTTANTWKTPIEDFTLIVERAKLHGTEGLPDATSYVSFCWDGPVTKVDDDHFSAHLINFIPAKELRVGYILHDVSRRPRAQAAP